MSDDIENKDKLVDENEARENVDEDDEDSDVVKMKNGRK